MNEKINAICPYFAMFPIDFPMKAIGDHRCTSVLDPFCGRGTTITAAAMNRKHVVGIDSSRVAFAITASKFADADPESIRRECDIILENTEPTDIPEGEFWRLMYDPDTLSDICRLREALMDDCSTDERIALRAIVLGALHGPLKKDGTSSYLSNQFPRTYASKPDYSVRYWRSKGYETPPRTSLKSVVGSRSWKYYSGDMPAPDGFVLNSDSTEQSTFDEISERMGEDDGFDLVVTSPPYVGMYTYVPDQWVRNWFVGGPPKVEYSLKRQIHSGEEGFISQLRTVWGNCESVCRDGARMVVRFGNIGSCRNDPFEVVRRTFDGTSWEIEGMIPAGTPRKGRRQRDSFSNTISDYKEIDVVAILTA